MMEQVRQYVCPLDVCYGYVRNLRWNQEAIIEEFLVDHLQGKIKKVDL